MQHSPCPPYPTRSDQTAAWWLLLLALAAPAAAVPPPDDDALPVWLGPGVEEVIGSRLPGVDLRREPAPCPSAEVHLGPGDELTLLFCGLGEQTWAEHKLQQGPDARERVVDLLRELTAAGMLGEPGSPAELVKSYAGASSHHGRPFGIWVRGASGVVFQTQQAPASVSYGGIGLSWRLSEGLSALRPVSGLRSFLDVGVFVRSDAGRRVRTTTSAMLERFSISVGVSWSKALQVKPPVRLVVSSELGVGTERLWTPEDQDVQYIPEWTVLALGPSWEPQRASWVNLELLARVRASLVLPNYKPLPDEHFRPHLLSFQLGLTLRVGPTPKE